MAKIRRRNKVTGRFEPNKNKWEEKDGLIYCYKDEHLLFFTDDKRVKKHIWCKMADGYSATHINGKEVFAHRFIAEQSGKEVVDHINRDKKDNRRKNLRNTNKSINAFNSKLRVNNSSGKRGVYLRSDTKRWSAEIKKDGVKIPLGCYATKEEAIKAREEGELKYYGFKLTQ